MSAHSGMSTPGQDDGDGDDDVWHLLHFPGDLITVNVWLFGLVREVLLLMVASHLTRNMLSVYILLAHLDGKYFLMYLAKGKFGD